MHHTITTTTVEIATEKLLIAIEQTAMTCILDKQDALSQLTQLADHTVDVDVLDTAVLMNSQAVDRLIELQRQAAA